MNYEILAMFLCLYRRLKPNAIKLINNLKMPFLPR